MTTQPEFEPDTLLEQTGGDAELTSELIRICLAECPALLRQIRAAVDARDADRLKLSAHTLAGALLNFGARRAVAASQALEMMGRERNLEGADQRCQELESAFAAFERELIEYRV